MERFTAEILEAERGGTYVQVPPAVVEALGGQGRIPVRATFDGIAHQGSVVSMGGGKMIGLPKAIRTRLGKAPGDEVTVTVEVDRAPRTVNVPDDLQAALSEAGLSEPFATLSFSHQREYVAWIDEAKKAGTRARRIRQTIERLER